MPSQKSSSGVYEMTDAISKFLASPPEGTPAEVIEAFNIKGIQTILPPRLFHETVDQAPVAISITDPNAQILYVNSVFEELTGYRRDEIISKNESVLSSKSTPESVYKDLWGTINNRKVWKGTIINHRKNKEEYVAELTISPVLTPQGEIGYFLGMHRDLTKVHQLEHRLKFQKAITEAALDAAPLIVVILSQDRTILLDNHAYKKMVADFPGIEPAKLFIGVLEQEGEISFDKFFESKQGFNNVEIRIDPPNGKPPRWFSCSGSLIDELNEEAKDYFRHSRQNSACLLLIANDITASRMRYNEARLNMIRATMAEQQMVLSLRETISASIYKLQEPLNIIKAALSMPDPSGINTGMRTALLQALRTGDEAMESLHEALPSLSKEQPSKVNINEILHEIIRLFVEHFLTSGVIVDWRPKPVLSHITGRPDALHGLLKYVIDNAIEGVNESHPLTAMESEAKAVSTR